MHEIKMLYVSSPIYDAVNQRTKNLKLAELMPLDREVIIEILHSFGSDPT